MICSDLHKLARFTLVYSPFSFFFSQLSFVNIQIFFYQLFFASLVSFYCVNIKNLTSRWNYSLFFLVLFFRTIGTARHHWSVSIWLSFFINWWKNTRSGKQLLFLMWPEVLFRICWLQLRRLPHVWCISRA